MIFNKTKKDEAVIEVLGEIRDNLKYGINEDRFDEVIRGMDSKINDAKYELAEEVGVISSISTSHAGMIDKIEKDFNNHDTLIKGLDDNMTLVLNEIESLKQELYNQIAINKKLKNELDWCISKLVLLEKDGNNSEDKYVKEFIKHCKSTQFYGKAYTGKNIVYDGFYFKAHGGRASGQIKFDILQLKDLKDKLYDIIKGIVEGEIVINRICKEYNISNNVFPRILYNLVDTQFFDIYLEGLKQQHLYQNKNGMIYIDYKKTGMTTKDVAYIKSCLNNSNNKYDTIKNFMGLFKEIDNNYIRIISCNIDKIPNDWLENHIKNEFENNPQKRKEKGMN